MFISSIVYPVLNIVAFLFSFDAVFIWIYSNNHQSNENIVIAWFGLLLINSLGC